MTDQQGDHGTWTTWSELAAPTIARCELAAKLGMNATWNSDGAQALGELLRRMAAAADGERAPETSTKEG